jgi:RNA polymerase sigma-70 factor (ECF subfamily)
MDPDAKRPDAARDALIDELLVVRCQLGERAAFDELIERWHEPLWRYLRRVVGDPDAAAETLQDAWLRALRALPGLREPARLRPWLFTIARRASMDRLRRKYAEPASLPIDDVDVAGPEESSGPALELDTMHDELERMPVVEREVLVLFYLEELTIDQLAEVLAVPAGTVKSRLFRARRTLRRHMTAKGVRP